MISICSVSLYTKVQEFDLATKLVEDWLSNEENCTHSRHSNMMEFYIRCVLHQREYNRGREFVENNQVLGEDERNVSISRKSNK